MSDTSPDGVYAAVQQAMPELAALVLADEAPAWGAQAGDTQAPTEPGRVLADPGWLADRVRETGRPWSSHDQRINATLWWYSASLVLLAPPASALVTCGRGVDPHPTCLALRRRPNGYLEATRSSRVLAAGPGALGEALAAALDATIRPLAEVSGATPRSLWAIAADSTSNRLLAAATATGQPARTAAVLAEQVVAATGGLMPGPRFVTVRERTYVRRASCCLIYLLPGESMCVSCPRQRPERRLQRLAVHAGLGS
jgi:hypothetical protein